jgi:hypothetical protein
MNEIDLLRYLNNYTINSDNTIDVNGEVDLYGMKMEKLPVKFGKVLHEFDCSLNQLTTLEGCPNYVGDNFYCYGNNLTTLEGCPNYVGIDFSCVECELTSLKGIEKCEILGDFRCLGNYKIPPENYIYVLTAKIRGNIYTGYEQDIDKILNKYKNEVKYLHKALFELKKVNT